MILRPVSVLLGLASSIAIARLLSPAEVGVFAVAYGGMALLAGVAHFGAVDYLVQHRKPDVDDFGRVLTITVGIAVVLAAVTLALRNWIASVYGEALLADLLALLAVNIVIGSLGVAAVASLQRDYAFATLQVVNLGAVAVGAFTACGLAWFGWSAESLAWGQVAASATTTASLLLLRPAAILCPPILRGSATILRFGAMRSLTLLASNSSDHAVPLILGGALGFTAAGIYDRANGIASRLNSDIAGSAARVLFVSFAEAKADRNRVAALLIVATGNLLAAMWPILSVLGLLAEPLIVLLYGDPWREAAPVLAWLAVGGMAYVLCLPAYELMTADGRVGIQLVLECLGVALRLGLLGLLASLGGLTQAAAGGALGLWLLALITWIWSLRYVDVAPVQVLMKLVQAVALCVGASVGPIMVVALADWTSLGPLATLTMGAVSLFGGWLVVARCLKHSLLAEMLKLFRSWPNRLFLRGNG